MAEHRVYSMSVARVYPCYVEKVVKKGRTKREVNKIIYWLTGHDSKSFQKVLRNNTDMKTFFKDAPKLNPKRKKITGVVCGVRVEEVKEKTMREIRYLDKLIDELAKGKAMENILRN